MLLPWLPTLITTLREQAGELVPVLVREAGRTFPGTLAGARRLDAAVARAAAEPRRPARPGARGQGCRLLAAHPVSVDAVAALLDLDPRWPEPAPAPRAAAATGFVAQYPDAAEAMAHLTVEPSTA